MRVSFWDDLPDVDIAPRSWCEECRRRTLFNRDQDGIPVCRECNEAAEAALSVVRA